MLVLIVVVLLLWHSSRTANLSSRAGTAVGNEEKAYLRQFEFTEVKMSAAENFLGTRVTYMDARVLNKGAKTVRKLDVDLTFVDMLNQVVLRETAHVVTERTPPLAPGESRTLHVSFEHIPLEWNQAAPAIVPVSVKL